MDIPPRSFDAGPVVAALETNLYDLYRFIGRKGQRLLVDEGDISWVNADPSWPRFLFDPRFLRQGLGQRLSEIANRIGEHGIPNVMQVGTNSQPAELRSCLTEAGFKDLHVYRPGMALDLTTWQTTSPTPDALTIIRAQEAADVTAWASLASGTDPELYLRLVADDRIALYLGLVDGVPAARSLMYLSSGVAGLYLVGVLEHFRRRGIGRAITEKPLADARERGCYLSVLMATQLGEILYSKIGFTEYMKLEYYGWTPDQGTVMTSA